MSLNLIEKNLVDRMMVPMIEILEVKQKKHRDAVTKDRQEVLCKLYKLQLKVEKEKRRKFDGTLVSSQEPALTLP